MGHPTGYRARGQVAGRKYFNSQDCPALVMGTRKTKVRVYGIPVDITEDRMGTFFSQYEQVEEVSAVISKAGIATRDFVLQVTLTRRSIADIPNLLMCREKRMLVVVVVEDRRSYCWSYRTLVHISKACFGKNVTPQYRSTATAEAVWQDGV